MGIVCWKSSFSMNEIGSCSAATATCAPPAGAISAPPRSMPRAHPLPFSPARARRVVLRDALARRAPLVRVAQKKLRYAQRRGQRAAPGEQSLGSVGDLELEIAERPPRALGRARQRPAARHLGQRTPIAARA